MTKKLIRIGNSQGLEIDKPIMDLLGITMDTELEVRTDGEALVIRPLRRENVVEAHRKVMGKHAGTFRKLAR